MYIIDDANIEEATQKLVEAQFEPISWAYGTEAPPELFRAGPETLAHITRENTNFDRHAKRLIIPAEIRGEFGQRHLFLLPSSYAHIQYPQDKSAEEAFTTILDNTIAWPGKDALLRSFVQMLVREPIRGCLTSTLTGWAISYVYGDALARDDALDDCNDEQAKKMV